MPAQQPARISREWRDNWSSVSRDLIITFLAVLLALAANNAWQNRRDQARERADLERLLPAARENENRAGQAVREDSITEVRVQRMTEVLESNAATPPLDSMVAALSAISQVARWRPVTGTFAALAQTGGLRQIRDAELRGRIAGYQRALDSTADAITRIEPIAFENRLHVGRLRPPVPKDPEQALQLAESLRGNFEVRHVLADIRSLASHRVALLQPIRDESAALRKALESELQVNTPAKR